MDWALMIAAGSLELVILTSAVTVVWKLTRTEIGLRREHDKAIAEINKTTAEKEMQIRTEHGKEITLLSSKIYQVEIWCRDEFVRKGSFDVVVGRLEKSMELLGAKVENAVDKLATRIENMNNHHHRED
jgi:hypothetical protein